MATLIAVLLASLFGSLHCVGMCGALMAFAVGGADRAGLRAPLALQIAYHGGRLVTYALMGAVCGLLGQALDAGGAMLGWNRLATYLAGGMMVAVGMMAILRYQGWRLPHMPLPTGVSRLALWSQRLAMGLSPLPRALTIGLLTALLPCGWLYAFALIAAGAGSVALGAAIMAAFWLGTVPLLAAFGTGIQALSGTVGRRVPLVTSLLLVGLGLYTLAGRAHAVPAAAIDALRRQTAGAPLIRQIERVGDTIPPCCQPHER